MVKFCLVVISHLNFLAFSLVFFYFLVFSFVNHYFAAYRKRVVRFVCFSCFDKCATNKLALFNGVIAGYKKCVESGRHAPRLGRFLSPILKSLVCRFAVLHVADLIINSLAVSFEHARTEHSTHTRVKTYIRF